MVNATDKDRRQVVQIRSAGILKSTGGIKVAKMIMIRKCEKCGKLQEKNKKESNKNWNVYDCNVKCECGGAYVTDFVAEEKKKR